jgi:hypothetical protein
MINYANPQGVGATAPGIGPANPAGMQRDAITNALMNVANPPPRTPVPGMGQQQGSQMQPNPALSRPPNNLAGPSMPPPGASMAAAGAMPGAQPPGIMAQANMNPTALTPPPANMLPPTPATSMPMGGPQPGGAPVGPSPLTQQLMPPGVNPGNY